VNRGIQLSAAALLAVRRRRPLIRPLHPPSAPAASSPTVKATSRNSISQPQRCFQATSEDELRRMEQMAVAEQQPDPLPQPLPRRNSPPRPWKRCSPSQHNRKRLITCQTMEQIDARKFLRSLHPHWRPQRPRSPPPPAPPVRSAAPLPFRWPRSRVPHLLRLSHAPAPPLPPYPLLPPLFRPSPLWQGATSAPVANSPVRRGPGLINQRQTHRQRPSHFRFQ
jgi:hypothetical protein